MTDKLVSWLTEQGSLTKRLKAKYQHQFNVNVVLQQTNHLCQNESQLLSLPNSRYQIIREVILNNGEQAVILARTIIPEQTLKIARNKLSHLGNKPLGEVIFAYPDLEIRDREFSLVETNAWSLAVHKQVLIEQKLWGRRTVYAIHDQPLLVAEFFLPTILL